MSNPLQIFQALEYGEASFGVSCKWYGKHKLHVHRKQMFFKPKEVIVLDQGTVQTSVQVFNLFKIQSRPLILQ